MHGGCFGCDCDGDRMASACFDMCVKDMEVSKLDVEEHICVDRCALKYFVVHQEVQGVMTRVREMNELRQQMMESQNAAYNSASNPGN